MNRPVPLIRRFTSISSHYQKDDLELEDLWSVLGRGERVEWGTLRDLYRCVILADAGAGKTFELHAEASRLAARDRAAFFIRIEDIDEAFGAAFEVGTAEAFERWLDGRLEAAGEGLTLCYVRPDGAWDAAWIDTATSGRRRTCSKPGSRSDSSAGGASPGR